MSRVISRCCAAFAALMFCGCSLLVTFRPFPEAQLSDCLADAAILMGPALADASYSFSVRGVQGAYQLHLQGDESAVAAAIFGPFGNREAVISARNGTLEIDHFQYYSLPVAAADLLLASLILSSESGSLDSLRRACGKIEVKEEEGGRSRLRVNDRLLASYRLIEGLLEFSVYSDSEGNQSLADVTMRSYL